MAIDVRSDFPILRDNPSLVYLDTAATAQKPEVVIETMDRFYRTGNASVHRGVYRLAREATDAFEGARERIAAFTRSPTRATVFTRNGTEALNLVAWSWGRDNVGPGDVVLVTEQEHHSNLVPWQMLCQDVGASLRYLEIDDSGRLSLDQLDAELTRGDVKVLAVAHVSNVLGTINPIAEMAGRARAAGAITVVDGCQAVPQMPVDFAALGVDFYAWTGHKAVGPTGIGVLHGREELLEAMRPMIGGGHMIATVERDFSTWTELPWKFEAGTSQITEAIGLGAAVDYLADLGMDNVRAHERELTALALERLGTIDGVTLLGPAEADARGGVVSFTVDGMHPHDVAELLDRDEVCIRAGHHCAQPLMRRLGINATSRASFGPYSRPSDVDALAGSLERARSVFAL